MLPSNIKTNIPVSELFQFRELGYIDKVLDELFKISDFEEFEFFIYFKLISHKDLIRVEKSTKKQVIFIVCDESDEIPYHLIDQAFAVFRHYLPFQSYKNKLFYLPLGYSRKFDLKPIKPINEKNINVFFSGNLHLGRARLYKHLTGLKYLPFSLLHRLQRFIPSSFDKRFKSSHIQFNRGFHSGLCSNDYNHMVYDSKIVFCPPGLSQPETLRHFEAMRAGCIIISEPMPDVHIYRGSPFYFVEKWEDADSLILELLDDEIRLAELQKRTLQWWDEKCSELATAQYIYSTLLALKD